MDDGVEAMAKRAKLTKFTETKAKDAAPPAPAKADEAPVIKGQTLRLNMDAWRQLKFMAIDRAIPAHELLIEALNDYFVKHGKPPLA